MFGGWDALGLTILFVGWPGLTLVSAYAIHRAVRFYLGVRHSAPGLLVLLTVVGWVLTLAGVALVSTLYLHQDPLGAGPVVLPVFVLWAGALVTVVWVVQRWGREAEKLDAYYGELERMERMKSGFINHVAHELNTPMTPIRMHMRMLRSDVMGPLTEKQSQALASVDRNLDRLASLVDQVMLASRLQAGRVALNPQPVDVRALLDEVAQHLQGSHEAGIEVEGGSVVIEADRDRLGYALEAVMTQAIRRAEGPIHVRLQPGPTLGILMAFSGRHMTRRDLQAFSDPEALQLADGIGVALYNADGLLRLHGGRIEAWEGGVAVRVPMAAPVAAREATAHSATAPLAM